MAWTIKGEAGKGLNTTERTLAFLGIESASLRFQSLADDTLNWTALTTDATGAGTIVPTTGQVVELFKDGTRKFRGHVTKVIVGTRSMGVTVSGPWWWMGRILISSNLTDDTGAADDRAQYVFPTGDLRTMIINLLDKAITDGVPMTRGSGGNMAEMFDFVKVILSDMTYAAALANLLGRCPDAVAWYDYSGSYGDLPRLKIARRGGTDAMADWDLEVGSDRVEELEISPRLDLKVSRVELPYMDRHPTTGKPRYQKQASGAATTGELQIITVSGPEIVQQLPLDDFDSYLLKTLGATGVNATVVAAQDSGLAAIKKQFGGLYGEPAMLVITYNGNYNTPTWKATQHFFPPLTFQRDNGTVVSSSGKYLVTSADAPDWVIKKYNGVRVTVTGTWIATRVSTAAINAALWESLQAGAATGGGYNNTRDYYFTYLARPFTFTGVLIDTKFSTQTRVYKPWDYTFLNPPAGMAAGLRAAQNWVPWEGRIVIAGDEASGNNLLNRTVNLSGALPECASMRATLKAISYDIMRARQTLELGAPARLDFGSAMGRVPRNAQGSIVKIS